MNTSVIRIGIDGGPCSGKTTGMSYISEELTKVGVIPIVMPEAATLLINSGIEPSSGDPESFQRSIVRLQLSNEAVWMEEAKALQKRLGGKKCVILCDRGLVGAAAYLPEVAPLESLNAILGEFGMDIEQARTRYAGVIHMVTAANGAESDYTCSNNQARKETPEQARRLDERTMAAWLGHPHLAVVANTDRNGDRIPFEAKIHRAFAGASRILGLPEPLEIEDKYLLRSFDPAVIPVPYETVEIAQTYLVPEESGAEERVRMRQWLGCVSYFHTTKRPAFDGARIEIERTIDAGEYERLLKRADLEKRTIRKRRHCFVWKSQYFEADVFQGSYEGLCLLERERTDLNDTTEIPPFMDVVRDVTNESAYKNGVLATSAGLPQP